MSTILYSRVVRERHLSGERPPASPKKYLEMVAALVPLEVLGLHALALEVFTESALPPPTTWITNVDGMRWAFVVMVLLSMLFYAVPKWKTWSRWSDYLRVLIPPLAFVLWTALQRVSAFDAWFPALDTGVRFFTAAALASLLTFLTARLPD